MILDRTGTRTDPFTLPWHGLAMTRLLPALLILGLATPALADDSPDDAGATTATARADSDGERGHPASRNAVVVAPYVGVSAPQLFSDLGSWAVFGLELGVILPFDVGPFTRPLQLALDTAYTNPGASGSGENEHLGDDGAEWNWELRQRMLTFQFSVLWRFMAPGDAVSVYALVGPRLYLMESVLEASGNNGEDFGQNRETSSEFGVGFGGGVDIAAGPGTIFGTLLMSTSNLDQRITGDTNTGALSLNLGYRFYF